MEGVREGIGFNVTFNSLSHIATRWKPGTRKKLSTLLLLFPVHSKAGAGTEYREALYWTEEGREMVVASLSTA